MNRGDEAFLSQIDQYGRLVFSPVGSSMYPMMLGSRDVVVLARPESELRVLDVALYRDDGGQYVLHRIVGLTPEKVLFWGDGRMTPDEPVARARVLAVMTGFYRKNRFIDAHSRGYVLYARIWHALRFGRRLFLIMLYWLRKIESFFKKGDAPCA